MMIIRRTEIPDEECVYVFEKCKEYRADSLTVKQACAAMKISKSQIYRRLKRMGVTYTQIGIEKKEPEPEPVPEIQVIEQPQKKKRQSRKPDIISYNKRGHPIYDKTIPRSQYDPEATEKWHELMIEHHPERLQKHYTTNTGP